MSALVETPPRRGLFANLNTQHESDPWAGYLFDDDADLSKIDPRGPHFTIGVKFIRDEIVVAWPRPVQIGYLESPRSQSPVAVNEATAASTKSKTNIPAIHTHRYNLRPRPPRRSEPERPASKVTKPKRFSSKKASPDKVSKAKSTPKSNTEAKATSKSSIRAKRQPASKE